MQVRRASLHCRSVSNKQYEYIVYIEYLFTGHNIFFPFQDITENIVQPDLAVCENKHLVEQVAGVSCFHKQCIS